MINSPTAGTTYILYTHENTFVLKYIALIYTHTQFKLEVQLDSSVRCGPKEQNTSDYIQRQLERKVLITELGYRVNN